MKTKNTNKGITLIALVITIIVMLILVAVTITIAVNGGLFEYAGRAGTKTNEAIAAEQQLANGRIKVGDTWYDSIDDYIKKKPSADQSGGTSEGGNTEGEKVQLSTYDEARFENGVLAENATYTSGIYTAVVPKGFKIVPGLNGTTTIEDGLVITDAVDDEGNSIGNEFVWIPVEVKDSDTQTSIASFYRSKWSNNARTTGLAITYTEPYADGYKEEAAEYNAMVKSVYENEGFYVGRYEAGSTTARTNVANGTTEVVVKRDSYPYNYVGWGLSASDYTSNVTYSNKDQGLGALALSKAMYENKDVGVTSTLCYGIQWDAMLDFIKDEKNVTNSSSWGNYGDTEWTITRTSAKYYSNMTWTEIPEDGLTQEESYYDQEMGDMVYDSTILTTGASDSFAAKNIFDVAGNCSECTNESWGDGNRVSRGGSTGYVSSIDGSNSSSREGVDPASCFPTVGFRPVLCVK